MRKLCRIKVVPKADPKADGEWHEIELSKPEARRLKAAEAQGQPAVAKVLAPFVPEGWVLAGYRMGGRA